jgi:hypothetical protein
MPGIASEIYRQAESHCSEITLELGATTWGKRSPGEQLSLRGIPGEYIL